MVRVAALIVLSIVIALCLMNIFTDYMDGEWMVTLIESEARLMKLAHKEMAKLNDEMSGVDFMYWRESTKIRHNNLKDVLGRK